MMLVARIVRRGRLRAAWAALVLCIPAATWGQDSSNPGAAIRDEAKMFDPEAVRKAREVLERVERESKVPVVIETIESLEGQALGEVAARQARRAGTPGVFLLIAKKEHKISDPLPRRQLADRLPEPARRAILAAFLDEFKKGDFDAGLRRGVEEIAEVLAKSAGTALVARDQVRLTLAGARRVLAGAEAKAAEMGVKQNIAVVDDGGHLLAFIRMDGARPASAATAQTKAITAATFRQATGPLPPGSKDPDVLLNLSLQNAAAASGGKITTLFGGLPILVEGQVIGAVGVGGGTGEQDVEVAKAGVAAFLEALKGSGTAGE
jgi:uncharacterized protein GlcG (DUF336 family)